MGLIRIPILILLAILIHQVLDVVLVDYLTIDDSAVRANVYVLARVYLVHPLEAWGA